MVSLLLLSWYVPNIRQVRGKPGVKAMQEEPDMQVINLRKAVEEAYRKGYGDGFEDIKDPLVALSHYKEDKHWTLNTRQDLMALSGMSRDDHTGLHNGHDEVAVMCEGFDARDEPIPIRATDTHHTYETIMSAYDRGFLDKCGGKDKSIPEPNEL